MMLESSRVWELQIFYFLENYLRSLEHAPKNVGKLEIEHKIMKHRIDLQQNEDLQNRPSNTQNKAESKCPKSKETTQTQQQQQNYLTQ